MAGSEAVTTPSLHGRHSMARMWCGASTGGSSPPSLRSRWKGTSALCAEDRLGIASGCAVHDAAQGSLKGIQGLTELLHTW